MRVAKFTGNLEDIFVKSAVLTVSRRTSYREFLIAWYLHANTHFFAQAKL